MRKRLLVYVCSRGLGSLLTNVSSIPSSLEMNIDVCVQAIEPA